MSDDPVVKEVRRAREDFAAECDFDISKIMSVLREGEQKHPERLVTPEMFEKDRARIPIST